MKSVVTVSKRVPIDKLFNVTFPTLLKNDSDWRTCPIVMDPPEVQFYL